MNGVLALLDEANEALTDSEHLIEDDAMLALIKKISELGGTMRNCTEGCSCAVDEALKQIETAYTTVTKLKVVSRGED